MTPEQRAKKVVLEGIAAMSSREQDEAIAAISAAISEAVKAEREACAKLADSASAKAIRAMTP